MSVDSVNLRAQHDVVFVIIVDVHVARSARWRKNLQISQSKWRTPAIFLKERLVATETNSRSLVKKSIVNFKPP